MSFSTTETSGNLQLLQIHDTYLYTFFIIVKVERFDVLHFQIILSSHSNGKEAFLLFLYLRKI